MRSWPLRLETLESSLMPLPFYCLSGSLQAVLDRNFSFPHTATVLIQTCPWPGLHHISKWVLPWCAPFHTTIISLPKFYNMGQIPPLPTSDTFRIVCLERTRKQAVVTLLLDSSVQPIGAFRLWPLSPALPLPACYDVHTAEVPHYIRDSSHHPVTGHGPGSSCSFCWNAPLTRVYLESHDSCFKTQLRHSSEGALPEPCTECSSTSHNPPLLSWTRYIFKCIHVSTTTISSRTGTMF